MRQSTNNPNFIHITRAGLCLSCDHVYDTVVHVRCPRCTEEKFIPITNHLPPMTPTGRVPSEPAFQQIKPGQDPYVDEVLITDRDDYRGSVNDNNRIFHFRGEFDGVSFKLYLDGSPLRRTHPYHSLIMAEWLDRIRPQSMRTKKDEMVGHLRGPGVHVKFRVVLVDRMLRISFDNDPPLCNLDLAEKVRQAWRSHHPTFELKGVTIGRFHCDTPNIMEK